MTPTTIDIVLKITMISIDRPAVLTLFWLYQLNLLLFVKVLRY